MHKLYDYTEMYFLISEKEKSLECGLCRIKLQSGSHPVAFSSRQLGEEYMAARKLDKYKNILLSNSVKEEWFSQFPDWIPENARTNEIVFINSPEALQRLLKSPESFDSFYGSTY